MRTLEENQEGFRTTLGSNHLESYLYKGQYRDNPEIRRFGMLLMDENEGMAFYRTDNGIAVDIKKQDKHLVLGTANYGDPIPKAKWLCIARALADELDGQFMPDTFVPSDTLKEESEHLIQIFLSHLKHYEA